MGKRFCHNPRRILLIVAALAVYGTVAVMGQAEARKKASGAKAPEKESYTRPPVSRPIVPSVEKVNPFRTDRVILEYADSLYRESEYEECQILKGSVKFRQAGMWMFCDSAYYYPEKNSMDAFGHVRMEQGDTLFVYADKLFYNGDERMARLRCGPSQPQVKLMNRSVSLLTDSLDYDLGMELGWYAYGGTLRDEVNTLVSVYGEYSPATKNADFYHDVVLTNNEDGFTMFTDTLYYNTDTHRARIVSPTRIVGETDTIYTNSGWYDSDSENATLTSRSTVLHRDSANNVVTLEGDSIVYDKVARISRAYMFRGGGKQRNPMVLTDTANHTQLIGGYGYYNDLTREAVAAEYPLLMEFSRPDTLFLRADTIRTFMITERVWPESLLKGIKKGTGLPLPGDPDEVYKLSIVTAMMLPPDVEAAMRRALENRLAAETVEETEIVATADSVKPAPAPRDSSEMVDHEFHVAVAYHRARFFNQDVQGVADSIVVLENDSMLYMYRKPVVWSGERQVVGSLIGVHFNDSTADWATLPDGGIMSEHVDEDFYNQLTGKKMKAWFENKTLKRLEVSGNVNTIFLPQESDSTYNRLVEAESSFMTVDMDDREMKKLKMWPEVSGSVTPLFLVKRSQMYLPGFLWLERLRPEREWYGDRVRWADSLGEVSEELEQYLGEGRPVAPDAPALKENEPGEIAVEETESGETGVEETEVEETEVEETGNE